MEPPFQTETLVQIESKSADKDSDVAEFKAALEPSGGRAAFMGRGPWEITAGESSLSACTLPQGRGLSDMEQTSADSGKSCRTLTLHPSPLSNWKSSSVDQRFI